MSALTPAVGRRFLWIFVLGWLLRIAVAVEYEARHPLAQRPVIDERSYETWALEIADGDLMGAEVFFQEPLYPYMLGAVYAVAGPSLEDGAASERQRTTARHAQAFLGALVVAGVFLLAYRLFGAGAATIAGLAAATYRPLLLFPSLLLKPNLFLPVLVALVLLLATGRLARGSLRVWLGCGVLAGLGSLLRGNVLILLPFVVLWPLARAWFEKERLVSGLAASTAVLVGITVVLLPVLWRNHHVGGVIALTTSGTGTNLYGGNNALNPYGRATEFPWVRGIPEYEADDWRREAERRLERPLDPGESSDYWLQATFDSVAADPLLHLRILTNKLRLTVGAYEVPDNHDLRWDASHLFLLGLPWPGFGFWGWAGMVGLLAVLFQKRSRDRRTGVYLALFALAYLVTIVLTVTSMRVRLGFAVLLLPFAGDLFVRLSAVLPVPMSLRRWISLDEEPSSRAASGLGWSTALLAGLVALAVFLPVLSGSSRSEDLDKREYNHAVYLLELEEGLDQAEAIADSLAARYPGTSRVETLLAEVSYRRAVRLRQSGDTGSRVERERLLNEGLMRLREVVRAQGVSPRERFRARAVAGHLQLEAGDGRAAEEHLRTALDFDPADRQLRFALANALWLQVSPSGEERVAFLDEARQLLRELIAEASDEVMTARLAEVEAALSE